MSDFEEVIEVKEYLIAGMCKSCQTEMFAEGDEGEGDEGEGDEGDGDFVLAFGVGVAAVDVVSNKRFPKAICLNSNK
jgi:hypothetical protein